MIIDAHAHACGELLTRTGVERYLKRRGVDQIILCGGGPGSRQSYPYPLLSDHMREERVVGVINGMIRRVIGASGFAGRFDEENERVWELAQQLPGKVLNAYWVNPLEDDCLEKAATFYREKGFCMLKLHQCWTEFDIRCERCECLFCWAARQGIPVFLHLEDRRQAVRMIDVANQNPETTFIVAHMLWAGMMAAGLEAENVCFDLSSPQLYSMATLKRAWDCYGAERLILGSDTPYGLHNIEHVLHRIEALGMSEAERELVCGGNILRLLTVRRRR